MSFASAPLHEISIANDGGSSEIERLRGEVSALHVQLDAARDQFQAILDAVPGGVSWLDRDLCYLGINSHLAQTFSGDVKLAF